jgi:mannose-6-phosphate isomerase-like protein (cupin superfamily)
VYELDNPIVRPNESFAIVDMRNLPFMQPHYHEQAEVYFVVQGNGVVVVGGEKLYVQKDTTVVIPSDVVHFVIPGENLVLAVVTTPPHRDESLRLLSQAEFEQFIEKFT